MKLLKLRFKNINSLAGQWEIDFENPQFGEGLFAITGATGAGKTSVLDAICLGFYGQTARQKTFSKNENEVMTRGTGDCFAEVEFEIKGKRYRSTWAQHRGRMNHNCELQSVSRKIASLPDNNIIAEKIKEADAKIIELTGMDFAQFSRSVLLAQGQFDAFLKANEKERSDILEQVTGSEIYSKIGSAVFARWQAERNKKEVLENSVSFFKPLSDAEKEEIQTQLSSADERKKTIDKIAAELNAKILWIENLEKLRKNHSDFMVKKDNIEEEITRAKGEFDRLAIALSARKLDIILHELQSVRKAKIDAAAEELKRKNTVEAHKIKLTELSPKVISSEESAKTAKLNLETNLPLLTEIREMDKFIGLANLELKSAKIAEDEAKKVRESALIGHERALKSLQVSEVQLNTAKAYLDSHAADSRLSEILPSVETYLSIWNSRKKDADIKQLSLKKAETAVAEKKKALEDAVSVLKNSREDYDNAKVKRDTAEKIKVSAESEYESKKPDLDTKIRLASEKLTLTQTIATMEEHRKSLEDGKPCPLCGATEHPFAKGNIPALSAVRKEVDGFKKELEDLRSAAETARKAFEKSDKAFQVTQIDHQAKEVANLKADSEAKEADNTLRALRESAYEAMKEAGESWNTITNKLSETGLKNPEPKSIENEVKNLRLRQTEFEKQTSCAQSAAVKIESDKEVITMAKEHLDKANSDYAVKAETVKKKEGTAFAMITGRNEKFNGNPDEEEKRLRKELDKADKHYLNIKTEFNNLSTGSVAAQSELAASEESLKMKSEEETAFSAAALIKFNEAGFASESECIEARWNDKDVKRITEEQEKLKTDKISIEALIKGSENTIKTETEKALTNKGLTELHTELEAQVKSAEEERDKIAALDAKLKADEETRKRLGAQLQEIERQQKIFDKWNLLNSWIGGANGEQFKRYAQGITLSRLLKEANKHLLKMTSGRYEMFWKPENANLLPSVLDRHQGDVERPVSNFSGGETFMVSLSLALGLAGMASGKLRIDSLFLDEGFGTLDSQTLDTAVNTLAELHQTQGKLIGVISHIEQMKSQIPTRLEVRKVGNGRSEITGAGVSRLIGESAEIKPRAGKKKKTVSAEKTESLPLIIANCREQTERPLN